MTNVWQEEFFSKGGPHYTLILFIIELYVHILGVHSKSSIRGGGVVGWKDPDVRRKLEMIRMWDRLVNMDDSRLTKRVFLWDYNQPHDWCSDNYQKDIL